MPARSALCRTASSNGPGNRKLTVLSFRLSSNRIGFISEKSYALRSAVATKRSASASVLSSGNFFLLIGFDFLSVHVARADRSDENVAAATSHGEDCKQMPPLLRAADRPKSLLDLG